MKKTVSLLATIASTFALAQVGINNTSPKATLDITARTSDGSKAEGLLAPRLTGDQIKAADSQYSDVHSGALVYATAAATSPEGKTANITDSGYYFFDGNIWQRVSTGSGNNVYTADGSLDNNRTVNMPNKSLSFTPTGTQLINQFNVDGTTFSVDALNNRVGIGSSSPTERLNVVNGNILISNSNYKDPALADQLAGQLLFKLGGNGPENLTPVASISGIDKWTGGNFAGNLTFSTQNGTNIERMRIDHNGNVGIGTSAPGSTLEVVGSVAMPTVASTTITGPFNGLAINTSTGRLGTFTAGVAPIIVHKTNSTVSCSSNGCTVYIPWNSQATTTINTLGATVSSDANRHFLQVPSSGIYRVTVTGGAFSGSGVTRANLIYQKAPNDNNYSTIETTRIGGSVSASGQNYNDVQVFTLNANDKLAIGINFLDSYGGMATPVGPTWRAQMFIEKL